MDFRAEMVWVMRKRFQIPIDMKKIRYFRDKDSFWKFETGKPPLMKTGYYSRWQRSFFRSVEEFLTDPGQVEEVSREEAEEVGTAHARSI